MPTAYNINPTPFGSQTAGADSLGQQQVGLQQRLAQAGLNAQELALFDGVMKGSINFDSPDPAVSALRQKLGQAFGIGSDANKPGQALDSLDAWLKSARAVYNSAGYGTAAAGGAQAVDPRMAQRADTTAQIKDFIARMSAPVVGPDGRITDPILKQLATIGYNGGMNAAGDRGIAGGAASSQAAAMAQQTGLPYLQQRQSLAAQGLGLLNNNTISNEQLDQGAYGLNLRAQDLANQTAASNYQAQQASLQGGLGALGAVLGGGIGLLGGGDFKTGAQVGSSVLAGLGSAGNKMPSLSTMKPYGAF